MKLISIKSSVWTLSMVWFVAFDSGLRKTYSGVLIQLACTCSKSAVVDVAVGYSGKHKGVRLLILLLCHNFLFPCGFLAITSILFKTSALPKIS